ncbi:MAG: CPBP family intramembrane metalloprotease [Chthoniobacteraceae bacterium]|nr:CPBP family intramembrane metalloprotease [Chthoniobacteraceae bacterium]
MKEIAVGGNIAKISPTLKSLGKIIFYLLATVVLGALLAPPLYWGGQWLAGHGIFPALAETPFRRFFHRSLLVAALALLWPVARWLRVPGVRALGLEPNPRRGADLGIGFAASFCMMAALAAVMLALHVVKLESDIKPGVFLGAISAAIGASIVEEWLFRGAILGLLARSLPRYVALFFTSALFSILHFLMPDTADPQMVGWLSGFALIPGAFAQFREPWLVLGGFTTLFCVGWVLGWSRLKTRSLWMPFGLHAGWVFGLKTFSGTTDRIMKLKYSMPWFGDSLYVGIGSVLGVLLTGLIVWIALRRRTRSADGRLAG